MIETEINPSLASHGGRVALERNRAATARSCCASAAVATAAAWSTTLRNGIERTLRERFPEITAVRDATDHASGVHPYVHR